MENNTKLVLDMIAGDASINEVMYKRTLDDKKTYYIIGDTEEIMLDERFVNFVVDFKVGPDNSNIEFKVFEVGSNHLTSADLNEVYISGTIKWDACSHFYFGEEDETGNHDGYIYICGEPHFHNHRVVMFLLMEIAALELGEKFIDQTYDNVSIAMLREEANLLNSKIKRLEALKHRSSSSTSTHILTIKDKTDTYSGHIVDNEVFNYVRQLETAIKTGNTENIKKAYPRLSGDNFLNGHMKSDTSVTITKGSFDRLKDVEYDKTLFGTFARSANQTLKHALFRMENFDGRFRFHGIGAYPAFSGDVVGIDVVNDETGKIISFTNDVKIKFEDDDFKESFMFPTVGMVTDVDSQYVTFITILSLRSKLLFLTENKHKLETELETMRSAGSRVISTTNYSIIEGKYNEIVREKKETEQELKKLIKKYEKEDEK